MKANTKILAERLAAFNSHPGPRVGDYLRLPRLDERADEFTRFTHKWDDTIQSGGHEGGGYYLGAGGGCSYSGGLDPGCQLADLVPTDQTREGSVWFFDCDISGAGRAVYFKIPCRVFELRAGADVSGLFNMQTPYFLSVRPEPCRDHYRWTVTKDCGPCKGFDKESDLHAWLASENLALGQPADQSQRILWPAEITAAEPVTA